MSSTMDFGVVGGQRFSMCAVCGGVVALPDGAHMDVAMRQAGCADVLRDNNRCVADEQRVVCQQQKVLPKGVEPCGVIGPRRSISG